MADDPKTKAARLESESKAEIERSRAERQARETAKSAPPEDRNSSAARLRAFEDEVFGKRAVRINGQIERGVGSPYAAMTDERKAQYAALEDLVAAEQRLNDATAAVGAAEADRVAAEERLAQCDKAAKETAAEAEADQADADKAAAPAVDKSETEKTHKEKPDAARA